MNKKEIEAYKKALSREKASEALIETTLKRIHTHRRPKNRHIKRISTVAAAALLLVTAGFFIMRDHIVFNEITALELGSMEMGQIYTEKEIWTIKQLEKTIDKPISKFNSGTEFLSSKITVTFESSGELDTMFATLSYKGSDTGTIQISVNKKINEKVFTRGEKSKVKGSPVYFANDGQTFYAFFMKKEKTYLVCSKEFSKDSFCAFVKFLLA